MSLQFPASHRFGRWAFRIGQCPPKWRILNVPSVSTSHCVLGFDVVLQYAGRARSSHRAVTITNRVKYLEIVGGAAPPAGTPGSITSRSFLPLSLPSCGSASLDYMQQRFHWMALRITIKRSALPAGPVLQCVELYGYRPS